MLPSAPSPIPLWKVEEDDKRSAPLKSFSLQVEALLVTAHRRTLKQVLALWVVCIISN